MKNLSTTLSSMRSALNGKKTDCKACIVYDHIKHEKIEDVICFFLDFVKDVINDETHDRVLFGFSDNSVLIYSLQDEIFLRAKNINYYKFSNGEKKYYQSKSTLYVEELQYKVVSRLDTLDRIYSDFNDFLGRLQPSEIPLMNPSAKRISKRMNEIQTPLLRMLHNFENLSPDVIKKKTREIRLFKRMTAEAKQSLQSGVESDTI